jgi:excisionase family DNA binding protein
MKKTHTRAERRPTDRPPGTQQPGAGRTTYESVNALAAELGIGRQAAYAGLRDGTIPSIRIGRRFVVPKVAIQEWLKNARRSVA